ncbi:MAG: hypothetical protein PHS49_05325 [Candidatus Gracilibacteria bacterium]|nr:hypothetical protein [Candidatus Gracilibacteria bacterium]
MITLYLGVYTFLLALLWGLFIVAKIHSYKFKSFSTHIQKVTNSLIIFLIILSLIGYFVIFYGLSNTTTSVKNYGSVDTKEINY